MRCVRNDRRFVVAMLTAVLAAVLQLSSKTLADDQQSVTSDPLFAAEPVMRERDVQFKVSDEPYDMQLFAADPKLLEQKYVALVFFDVTLTNQAHSSLMERDVELATWYRSVFVRLPSTSQSGFGSRFGGRGPERTAQPIIDQIVESVPPDRRPPEEILSLLSDPQHLRLAEATTNSRSGTSQTDLTFLVLGSDLEGVKAKTRALLNLCDNGVSYPMQQALITQMQWYSERLAETKAKLASEELKIEALEEKLDQYEPIGEETIADLKTQQRLIVVEIAGAEARLLACTTILKRDDVRGRPIAEQVESVKITAEIELVGLTARKRAVDEIIQRGIASRELEQQLAAQQKAVNRLMSLVGNYRSKIAELEEARKEFLPFAVAENQITIRSINWEPASSDGRY